MAAGTARATDDVVETVRRRWTFRHPLVIRLAHWINVICLVILLMSGLQIFNAHPALYWGDASTFDRPFVAITDDQTDDGTARGLVSVAGRSLDTTGWLGLSNLNGEPTGRAFPSWITLPAHQDLATGRRWHFLFAWAFVINGLIYLVYGIGSGQLRRRLVPQGDQWRGLGSAIREHLTLRFPEGQEAKRYNVLQKLTYLVVVAGLLPLMLLTGLAMSPGVNALVPLPDLFGGRQSARTVHFLVMNLLVLFVIVHVLLVLLSGLWNNLRGMLTGWYVIERRALPAVPGDDR
ncbi:cytochrome b/b6 domain-containing protein [Methylobacterium sp. Leaf118]|uniref:cytochrome b/b6 domain-containing protein n=1 Tax=Methylobacterium sp. Leaf118 TaxID=2876562 RepID=UPI001E4CDF0D|nr:cytochrome b/b6 domain-containing protein [Methylobacterium sp. Leaf118]